MCSIIISNDPLEVRELVILNKMRGTHSWSLSHIKNNHVPITMDKGFGELDLSRIPKKLAEVGSYVIIHQQAPTTSEKDFNAIHPSHGRFSYLWHNGILKDKTIRDLQVKNIAPEILWDTRLMHIALEDEGNDVLNEIDGAFACVMLNVMDRECIIFRNAIAPFYTDGASISSTKFHNSTPIPHDMVYSLDYNKNGKLDLTPLDPFTTVNNPYYFGE